MSKQMGFVVLLGGRGHQTTLVKAFFLDSRTQSLVHMNMRPQSDILLWWNMLEWLASSNIYCKEKTKTKTTVVHLYLDT